MNIGLKWVHMARYELILRLDGALWLTIIFKPLLTPKGATKIKKNIKQLVFFSREGQQPGLASGPSKIWQCAIK